LQSWMHCFLQIEGARTHQNYLGVTPISDYDFVEEIRER
jgi:hypothetical protein